MTKEIQTHKALEMKEYNKIEAVQSKVESHLFTLQHINDTVQSLRFPKWRDIPPTCINIVFPFWKPRGGY